jgi:hypothetical protein
MRTTINRLCRVPTRCYARRLPAALGLTFAPLRLMESASSSAPVSAGAVPAPTPVWPRQQLPAQLDSLLAGHEMETDETQYHFPRHRLLSIDRGWSLDPVSPEQEGSIRRVPVFGGRGKELRCSLRSQASLTTFTAQKRKAV